MHKVLLIQYQNKIWNLGKTCPLPEVNSRVAGPTSPVRTQPRAPCEKGGAVETIPLTQRISQEGTNVGMGDWGNNNDTCSKTRTLRWAPMLWWSIVSLKESHRYLFKVLHWCDSCGLGWRGHKTYGHVCGDRAWGRHRYGNGVPWILIHSLNTLISTWPQKAPQSHILPISTQSQTSLNSLLSCLNRSIFYFQTNPWINYMFELSFQVSDERGIGNVGCPFGKKRKKVGVLPYLTVRVKPTAKTGESATQTTVTSDSNGKFGWFPQPPPVSVIH